VSLANPCPVWSSELAKVCSQPINWIWPGFFAAGNFTLLTGLWKAGKTTLLSLLLARRNQPGLLIGQPVAAGRTVYVSEENPELWAVRHQALNFGDQLCLFCRPFRRIPSPMEWQTFLASLLALHADKPFELLILDPIAQFLQSENNPKAILNALMPLTAFTAKGIALLATCHPTKGKPLLGQAARGSGALTAHADISLELRLPRNNPLSRRRKLHGFSRHHSTPSLLSIVLNDAGTDYAVVDDAKETFNASWMPILAVLESAPQKLTAGDVLHLWPSDHDKLSLSTVRNTLKAAHEAEMVLCEGTGANTDPIRYWLASREEYWRQTKPFYDILEEQQRQCNFPFTPYAQQQNDQSLPHFRDVAD
jgi:AAA domain